MLRSDGFGRFPMVKGKCHPERNEVESRDLRTMMTFVVKSVRRSFDSLCSLRMTKLMVRSYYFSLSTHSAGTFKFPLPTPILISGFFVPW